MIPMNKTYTIDASGKSMGRLASQAVLLLRGKDQADFAPHKESGNIVVVKNIEKMVLSGNKASQKSYFSHSGYPKGEKHTSLKQVLEKRGWPEILRRAVSGMLPKNRLRSRMIKNLRFE